jgi:Fe2+ or Zn2+ uptake regulation protein
MVQTKNFQSIATKVLKRAGARLTKPRLAVIECLEQNSAPLTTKEIIEAIQQDHQQVDIDPVTAYRILDRFCELGLVHQIAPSGRYLACTHLRCQEHYHVLLRCVTCHQVEERHVPQEVISPFFWYLSKNLQFQVQEHVFQLDGYCAGCRPGDDAD